MTPVKYARWHGNCYVCGGAIWPDDLIARPARQVYYKHLDCLTPLQRYALSAQWGLWPRPATVERLEAEALRRVDREDVTPPPNAHVPRDHGPREREGRRRL
jgi:hypothetical protein